MQDVSERGRSGKIIMRFDDHGNFARARIVAQFAQPSRNTRLQIVTRNNRMPGVRAVTEYAHVRRIECRSQVDESPSIRQNFGTLLRIGLVQAGGAADAGDLKTARENITLRLSDAFRRKCRVSRQVEVALQSAQFDCSETVLPCKVQNFLQIPGRAAQS